MSSTIIAFLIAISSSTWIYTKIQRKTGNNTQSSLIVAAVSFVGIFVLSIILLGFVPGNGA